ncbi:MAG: glycoside hydrolase family 127 protein [Verrucomicrobiota bacterium]|nr:glycoside hydrolase family 127 protein [Verrucomicrobiota bacterium]
MKMTMPGGNFRAALGLGLGVLTGCAGNVHARVGDSVGVVDRPPVSQTNAFYVSNRAPLEPSRLIPLPIGSIQSGGWLREILQRQRDGLCGHLGEISVWLEKDDNAWLNKDGKGQHGWEEVPYWLRGYIQLAYIFNDPKMIAESRTWIEGVLNSQRPDGDFGPDQKFADDGSRDFWANMLMMYCLETYYEHSRDRRVPELMTKYFRYQLTVPDDKFLTHFWQKMRGGDNLYSVYWLYNRTGDPFLLRLAEKIHHCTANWELQTNLPTWHNVNIAEGFREPATFFLQSHDPADLRATYTDFHLVRTLYGQVPGGMFGGDEICRPGYSDPRQAIETCGMVEQMFSDELLTQISGDPSWADNCENVAFNMFPAALAPDMRALRYLTAPNMVVSDARNHSPGIYNNGPFLMMNPFSSRCCQHNHSMGWPYFNKHLWFATPDDGLCAAIYAANEVTARVGDGTTVHFQEDTRYPFEETIRFTLRAGKAVTFPLYLRIPGWCPAAAVSVNGRKLPVTPAADQYARIEREWRDGDSVLLKLPMKVRVQQWTANHDSVSVNYGPLTFSLKIGERCVRRDSTKTAQTDSGWQKTADPSKWPAFEIYPTTPWNYGLVLDANHPGRSFTVKKLAWPKDNYPFTPAGAPIELIARSMEIPQWTLDRYELCSVLQQSPVWSDQPVRRVTLIPMGATRLRISAFPVIGAGPDAHHWQAATQKTAGDGK